MIGLDTNVLVRYLAQDEPRQSLRATKLFEKELSAQNPGFISAVVLAETCWVLERAYNATQAELAQTVEDLLDSAQLVVGERAAVLKAVARSRKGAGLVDCLITELAHAAGAARMVTFDAKAAKKAGMVLLA
ncbi:MAG: PIN domain-containing protein [Burkholderiaceae bacterium]